MREAALLIVVGAGNPEPFEVIARDVGMLQRVLFLGARTDASELFKAAGILVLPTRVDLWGATVVEAMAAGIPPVVSSAAGSAEVVANDETGLVLPDPFDLDTLAAALDQLARDPDLRRRMGEAGRAYARALSWAEQGRLVEASMEEVRAAGSRGGRDSTPRQSAVGERP